MTIAAGIDIESTDLDWLTGARIIEFGIVLYTLETGVRIGEWVQRINPECPIAPKAFAVHKISFDSVAHCPKFAEVAPKICALMAKADVWIGHNGDGFDFPFIRHELMKAGLSLPVRPTVDTMLEGKWATFSGKYPKLGELCFALDVPYDPAEAHAARYDIVKMMECYFKAANDGFFSNPMRA